MLINLTEEQLDLIRDEKIKKEKEYDLIPKSGHGWDIIYCSDIIDQLNTILDNKTIKIYE